jgi:integrase
MKLTDAKLRTLTQPGKHSDGEGLYLELTPAGGKYWRMKYRHGGKEKRMAFGVYPAVSLKDARDQAQAARKLLQAGDDPGEAKKAAKAQTVLETANTLQAVAADWMAHQSDRWEPATKARVLASLETDIYPVLGARPLASIRPGEVMRAVQKIEARGAGDQAARVLQRIKQVYRWAVTHERIEANPMLDLVPGEILKPREVKHRAALSDRDLSGFLVKLNDYQGDPTTVQALRLLLLTTTRPGEVRGARWSEFHPAESLWIIPADRMKMREEHRVPLSRQALQVLETMRPISGDRELVFPSPFYPSKPLSENTFNSALARMGYKNTATAHGFRALFSTVTNEHDRSLRDVIERQLAHKERDQVRAAYHRSTYLKDRAHLLQWWADYLDTKAKGAEVIQLDEHRAA